MKRVLLKLSGEALAGDKKTGFDEATCVPVAKQIKDLVDAGTEVAIVIGGDRDRRRQLLEGKDERDDRPDKSRSDRNAGNGDELYLCI